MASIPDAITSILLIISLIMVSQVVSIHYSMPNVPSSNVRSSPSSLAAPLRETKAYVSEGSSRYTIPAKHEYVLTVQTPPFVADVRNNGYVYNVLQNVTLTCERETKSSHQDYVVIRSCYPCYKSDMWITSERGVGRAEVVVHGSLVTEGYSGDASCQLTCLVCRGTCSHPPHPDSHLCYKAFDEGRGSFRTVSFGAPPVPLGIECMSANGESLTCTWTLRRAAAAGQWPVAHDDHSSASYSRQCNMSWDITCKTQVKTTVPFIFEEGGQRIFARLTIDAANYRLNKNYTIKFSASTFYGNITSTRHIFTDNKIVRFDRVQRLQVTPDAINSSVLHVQWGFPDSARALAELGRLECRLNVSAASSDIAWQAYDRTWTASTDDCCIRRGVALSGLHAHVTYIVRVRYRPRDGLFWSDDSHASGTTSENVPSRAPELMAGGYHSCGTRQCFTVYWKSLAPEYRNGDLRYYQVVAGSEVTRTPSADVNSHTVYTNTPTNATTTACVAAATSVGVSRASNCIRIFPQLNSSAPSPVEGVTTEYRGSDNAYVVRWRRGSTSSGRSADTLTVVWCWGHRLSSSTVVCQKNMDWAHMRANATSLVVNASTLPPPGSAGSKSTCHFGVSTVRGNNSVGIVWSNCSFSEEGQVSPPDFNVISNDVTSTAVTVTWQIKCDAPFFFRRPLCYEIHLFRRRLGANVLERNVSVDPDYDNRLEIVNLTRGSTYNVRMLTVSTRGRSDFSHHTIRLRSVETSETPKDDKVLVILIAVFSSIIVLSCASCLVWIITKKAKEAWSKFHPPDRDRDAPFITKTGLSTLKYDESKPCTFDYSCDTPFRDDNRADAQSEDNFRREADDFTVSHGSQRDKEEVNVNTNFPTVQPNTHIEY